MAGVVEVLEGGAEAGDDALFPRLDVFVVIGYDKVDWVEVQVAANVAVLYLLVTSKNRVHGECLPSTRSA